MASHLNQPQFKTPAAAREYLERTRWPHGPVCPHCGSVSKDHYPLAGKTTRDGLWKCRDCREQFSVTVGTVFEKSKIPLNVWLTAVYLLCSSKKGMSSHQLHRTLGVTYKTAWFMTHRIREAFSVNPTGPLGGSGKIVEADETYYGHEEGVPGKKALRGIQAGMGEAERKQMSMKRRSQKNKVVSLVERGGSVRTTIVTEVDGKSLKAVLMKQIHEDSHLMTDSSPVYNAVVADKPFAAYDQVNHYKGEYARGNVTTNTVESYFSLLKRGLIGTYHHVSSNHLHRYANEFDFRYNHRERTVEVNGERVKVGYNDKQRMDATLLAISGKRLTYRRINEAS